MHYARNMTTDGNPLNRMVPEPRTYNGSRTGPKDMKAAHLPVMLPGPKKSAALPGILPAGVIPDEGSRIWLFVPKSVQQGEQWIQDDTRDWFDDRERKVEVRRDYPSHPRWIIKGANTMRATIHNAGIVSEIHMLVRIAAGLPEFPVWVPARMTLKQTQSDLAFRLSKTARDVFIRQGQQALKDFAERAPGQFIKFIGATFVPKQIEAEIKTSVAGGLDPETADQIIDALSQEMQRRAEEAKTFLAATTLDYEPAGNVAASLEGSAQVLHEATADNSIGASRRGDITATRRLRDVQDAEQDVPAEVEWD